VEKIFMSMKKAIVVGFNHAVLNALQTVMPEGSVILIEEPEIIETRGLIEEVTAFSVVDRLLAVDYLVDATADALVASLKDESVHSVIPVEEYTTPFAARLAERLGLPGAGYGASLAMRNKNRLRIITSAHGINNPASRLIFSFAEAQDFARLHGAPLIVKPANRQGSLGTVIVHRLRDLKHAWKKSLLRDEGIALPRRGLPEITLIEKFINGREFSVEALVWKGQVLFSNVTLKDLFEGVNPVESGHTVPAPIAGELTERLVNETQKVLRATGFCTGIVHCEWKLADDVPYLVECAGRFPGDGIIGLIDRAYGIDITAIYFQLMQGDVPQDLPGMASRTAHVRFIGGRDGVVRHIKLNDAALSQNGIVDYYITVESGQRTFAPKMGAHRLGAVTVEADSAQSAWQLAEQAVAGIDISYRRSLSAWLK